MKNSILLPLAFAFALTTLAPATSFASAKTAVRQDNVMVDATTAEFKGVEVNEGTAQLIHKDGKPFIRLSDNFKISKAPSPHYQIVDSAGNIYTFNRVTLKGDKVTKEFALPTYVKDVSKVRVWCTFVEVLLGEAAFDKPVSTGN